MKRGSTALSAEVGIAQDTSECTDRLGECADTIRCPVSHLVHFTSD